MATRIEIGEDGVSVDAVIIAEAFGLEAADVPALMRAGEITSLFERGENEDAGRMRLTFFHRSRRFRLVVDETGAILQRSKVDFGDAPLPPAMRRPG
jgi:hypothetical protein